jgi:hypothetical protein
MYASTFMNELAVFADGRISAPIWQRLPINKYGYLIAGLTRKD